MAIHKITLPTPFAVGPVNVYVLDGEPLTLIDTGPNTAEALQTLQNGLRELGYALSDIQRVIITHTHPDHFGLVKRVVEHSSATVWTHPFNSDWFNDLETAIQRRGLFSLQVFQQAAVPQPIIEAMAQSAPRVGRMFETVPVNHWLNEGDQIEMDGTRWQVIHTPGHASGHIALYQPERQQMILGDHLLKHISSNPLLEAPREHGKPREKSLVQYLDSMRKIAQYDFNEGFTGHGENITEHRALIAERLSFHAARLEHIARLLDNGERTAYELMQALFPRLKDFDIFLGLSEVIGHLDILQLQGRLVELPRNGHITYSLSLMADS